VDAVFTVSLELAEDEVGRLLALGKPVVGVGGPLPGVSTLTIDDLAVARLATDHLISLGHIRIAHIGGSQEFDLDFHIPTSRRLGYEQALRDAGLPVDEQLHRASDFTLPGGYDAAKQLLGSPHERPTAIFAASDEMAIGAILAARDLGLSVPRDVSIIGIDDHPLADFFGLSTVAQHPDRQGEQAAALLLDALQAARAAPTRARPEPLSHTAPADLIVRSSTAVHP